MIRRFAAILGALALVTIAFAISLGWLSGILHRAARQEYETRVLAFLATITKVSPDR